jgi:hypothetical protein
VSTLPDRLLICGVPGAGKSVFADWLGETRAFRVLKFDAPADREQIGRMVQLAASGDVATAAALFGRRVVVEWGFMPDSQSHLVAAVIAAGFEGWWFDADLSEALPQWTRAHPGAEERYFHLQGARISSEQSVIERLFRGRRIKTLSGVKHRTGAEILAEMTRLRQAR